MSSYLTWKPNAIFFVLLFFAFQGVETSHSREPKKIVHAVLVSDSSTIVQKQTFRMGLLLRMQPGWHIFWKNPANVGMPIAMDWKLPDGFKVSALRWPIPEHIHLKNGTVLYGYRGTVLLIANVKPPEKLAVKKLSIRGRATWLACAHSCVPGSAELSITLSVASHTVPKNVQLFKKFEQLTPTTIVPFPIELFKYSDGMEIHVQPGDNIKHLAFFPLPDTHQSVDKITVAPPSAKKKAWVIRVPVKGRRLMGILVTENINHTRKGYRLNNTLKHHASQWSNNASWYTSSLLKAVLYGFLGGLILNLMPCILPVVSLKIFGFIQQAGKHHRRIFPYGLAFTAGVFSWFFLLASLVPFLKYSGYLANWTAFQFQNPAFNFVIITVTFILALNMFGIFDIAFLSPSVTGITHLTEKNGLLGAFFQGAFTTLLATPCTTPFLSTAFGFAINQSNNIVTFAIFGSAAAGLALPYLILSIQTSWIKFIPTPGIWMEWIKQLMGFPLLATAIWLLGVLGNQMGVSAMVATLAFLLCIALCCWLIEVYIKSCEIRCQYRLLACPYFLLLLVCPTIMAFAIYCLAWPHVIKPYIAESKDRKHCTLPWKSYSESVLRSAQATGQPVFVNFTADWCLFCKFNEKSALERPAVIAAFQAKGIVSLKADWTNKDHTISTALHDFGRVGVPFYVLYPPGKFDIPIILPTLLTEARVLNTVNSLPTQEEYHSNTLKETQSSRR